MYKNLPALHNLWKWRSEYKAKLKTERKNGNIIVKGIDCKILLSSIIFLSFVCFSQYKLARWGWIM